MNDNCDHECKNRPTTWPDVWKEWSNTAVWVTIICAFCYYCTHK